MPAIYQRLCFSLRRRPRRPLRGQTSNIASTTQGQHQISDLSGDEAEALDDGRSSPPPLPVISDRGPPTSNRYGDAGLFWNSTMHEADKNDKLWLTPSRPGKLQTEDEYTGRSRLPRHGFTRDIPPPKQNGYAQEEHTSKPPAPRAAAARQKLDIGYANRNDERNISYGRERADNDLTVMYYVAPGKSHTPSVPSRTSTPPRPQRSNPGEREHGLDVSSERPPPAHLVESQQPEPPIGVPVSASSAFGNAQEVLSLEAIHAYRMPNPSSLSFSTTSREPMIWSTALGQILRNDHVDPYMKRQVKNRVKGSNTTNGDGEGEHFHVAPVAVGLVPNFSYPVAGSAFYDRHVAGASESPDPNNQVTKNVVGAESTVEHRPSTDTEQQNFDFGFGPNDPHGVPSHSFSSMPTYSSSLSLNESTSPTTAPSRQPSSGDSIVSTHLNFLLLETLSKSQIDLLNTILATPPNTPASSSTPSLLTHSLHALLLHLQDRTLYFEANLLPELGTALEHKTHIIDVQSAEIQNLDDQITQLKATIDFSSKTLTSCWARDWEMWRSLTGIREGRRPGWWDFRRTRGPEGVDNGQQFSGRELDALIMIAEQNVSVLKEDVEDMVEKVEGCKRASAMRPIGEEEEAEPEEGSWRDV